MKNKPKKKPDLISPVIIGKASMHLSNTKKATKKDVKSIVAAVVATADNKKLGKKASISTPKKLNLGKIGGKLKK